MKEILYFPDYGCTLCDPNHVKDRVLSQLHKICKPWELRTADDELITESPVEVLNRYVFTHNRPEFVVGKGFGAFFALLIGMTRGCRTILINPMYPISRYLSQNLPDYKFEDQLSSYEFERICGSKTKKAEQDNVFVVLGEDDDVIDAKRTSSYFIRENCVYIPGGHDPDEENLNEVLGFLFTNPSLSPDQIRTGLAAYRETGGFSISGNQHEESGLTDSAPKFEYDKEQDEDESSLELETIVIEDVQSENGNFTIRFLIGENETAHCFYIYYENGAWYRDTDSGYEWKMPIVREVMKRASEVFAEQTVATHHTGQDFWGWPWLR